MSCHSVWDRAWSGACGGSAEVDAGGGLVAVGGDGVSGELATKADEGERSGADFASEYESPSGQRYQAHNKEYVPIPEGLKILREQIHPGPPTQAWDTATPIEYENAYYNGELPELEDPSGESGDHAEDLSDEGTDTRDTSRENDRDINPRSCQTAG